MVYSKTMDSNNSIKAIKKYLKSSAHQEDKFDIADLWTYVNNICKNNKNIKKCPLDDGKCFSKQIHNEIK